MPRETAEERAERERAEALERVRAHRRQSANTRAMRPVGSSSNPAAPSPQPAQVTLSDESFGMLDRQTDSNVDPKLGLADEPPEPNEADVGSEFERASETSRPPKSSRQARPTTRPIRHSGETTARPPTDVDHLAQLRQALRTVEALLSAGELDAALAVVRDNLNT